MAGSGRPPFSAFEFVAGFFAVYGVRPKATFQYIHFCIYFRYRRMAGGRRPPFSIFMFVGYLCAEYGGRPKAALQYIQVYSCLL